MGCTGSKAVKSDKEKTSPCYKSSKYLEVHWCTKMCVVSSNFYGFKNESFLNPSEN